MSRVLPWRPLLLPSSAAPLVAPYAAGDDAAAAIDLDAMPESLLSRRAQVNLDLARAQSQRRRDVEATMSLPAAESVAPEAVAQDVVARAGVLDQLGWQSRRDRVQGKL